jgi:predicted acylesterase/phospholipase RssA/CRP-like cAMP-binding protein
MIDLSSLSPFFDNKDSFVSFLKTCHLLKKLSSHEIHDLILKNATIIKYESGKKIADYDSTIDSVYIVIHGRIKLTTKKRKNIISHEILPSESIGEIDILSHRHPILVEAVRDSLILKITSKDFMSLIQTSTTLLENTCNVIAAKMHKHISISSSKDCKNTSIALVPTDTKLLQQQFAEKIKLALSSYGSTLLITSKMVKDVDKREEEYLSLYCAKAESKHDYVILLCDREMTNWTKFCLRSVDKIFMLISLNRSCDLSVIEKHILQNKSLLAKKSLIFCHNNGEKPNNTTSFLDKRQNLPYHHICIDNDKDFEKLGRIFTNNAIGLVLSGGGARGIAQIGIIAALIEAKIPIDYIGGTSIGSVIAGLYALGLRKKELLQYGPKIFIKNGGIIDLTLPLFSFAKGKKVFKKLQNFVKVPIEDLQTTFYCISTNLSKKRQHIHTTGLLSDAIRASISLPGIFPVFWKDKEIYVDGGLFNILPIDVMKNNYSCVGTIIAVDTSSNIEPIKRSSYKRCQSVWKMIINKLFKHIAITPSIISLITRTTDMRGQMRKQELIKSKIASLYIRPPIDSFKTLDFSSYEKLLQAGYSYAKSHIDEWKKQILKK